VLSGTHVAERLPMKNFIALLALVSLAAACGKDSKPNTMTDTCTSGVDHVFKLTSSVGTPSADEQRAMDEVKKQGLAQCRTEGLSQAQLDCILATRDVESLSKLGECPAIKSKRPSWLMLP
jgi:hypothetical protein